MCIYWQLGKDTNNSNLFYFCGVKSFLWLNLKILKAYPAAPNTNDYPTLSLVSIVIWQIENILNHEEHMLQIMQIWYTNLAYIWICIYIYFIFLPLFAHPPRLFLSDFNYWKNICNYYTATFNNCIVYFSFFFFIIFGCCSSVVF